MLLQTNSYFVPKDKRTEHARLVKRFGALMNRLGCAFETYEQAGPNWSNEVGGRFVQIMKFRDETHQKAVRDAEQSDAGAQDLVREFCELIDYARQTQQGMATTAYYKGVGTPVGPSARSAQPLGGEGSANGSSTGQSLLPAADSLDELSPIDSHHAGKGLKHSARANGEIDD